MFGLFFLGKVKEIMVAHNHNISKILNTPTFLLPWEHKIIKNALDEETVDSLLEAFHTIDWDNVSKDDFEAGIQTKWISQDFIEALPQSLAKDVLQELNSRATHELLLQQYNIDYSTGYEASLVFDRCNPNGLNEVHNDTGPRKDTLTLQYYLQIDDETRTLHLDNFDTRATFGDAVIFKSQPHTMHSFKAGKGNRFSLRLRIGTNILNPKVIQNKSDSKVGVLIDCKDMESDSCHRLLEVNLGAVTYRNLIQNGFSNIVTFREREDFESARDLLKEHGVERILMVFAGATVDNTTLAQVYAAKHITAPIDNDTVLRQFVVFDTNDSDFDIVGDYLGNVKDKITHADMMDLGIALLHPDEDSVHFLEEISEYLIPRPDLTDKLSEYDKELAGIIKERVKEIKYV
jgi:hypothetical protein